MKISMNRALHLVHSRDRSDGRAQAKNHKWRIAFVIALVVLTGIAAWYVSRPDTKQVELGRHVTEKFGPYLHSHGITAIRYEEGTWSITKKLTINDKTVDLSSSCASGMNNVCGSYYTLFLGGTDSFSLVADGSGYAVLANIDRSKIQYADSEKQIDKAMQDIVNDYEARQNALASWNRAK
ncbi:hypothetical protein M3795_25025 [Ralstonia pickettii]|uniref:hypothetical protein n=1 Tax=Ralstonia pickettii TaxID=329 RepID=UPI00203B5DB0|nr:hypothetical protein [Ralstonia pickettii]MCM3583736.1 hypothetical protein [Ralstonia pickettii]